MRTAALLALALPLVAARSDPLAGRVAGPPAQCIGLSQVTGPEIVDAQTILYRQGGRIWRANLAGRCVGLRPFNTLIVDVYGGQLCRNDRFRVLELGTSIPGPDCRFSSFTPYDRR